MMTKQQILAYLLVLLIAGVGIVADGKEGGSEKQKKAPAEAERPGKIVWLRYDEAVKKSRTENKHVLIDFTATWCGWCKRMKRDTFSKSEVIEMINDNFVPAQVWDHKKDTLNIDGYKIREKDLGRSEFGVTSYPTFWFLSPDGKRIGPIRGYLPPEQFMKALEYVKDYRYDTSRVATNEPEKSQP